MEMKQCSRCGEVKSVDCYYKDCSKRLGISSYCKACKNLYVRKYYANNKKKMREQSKDRRNNNIERYKATAKRYYEKNKDKVIEKSKEYYKENKDIVREKQTKYEELASSKCSRYLRQIENTYGIVEEDIRGKQDEQKGMCVICKESLVNPVYNKRDCCVDHNHYTGEVRGLLCGNCNTAFGLLEEDRDRIINMINYLDKWEQYD